MSVRVRDDLYFSIDSIIRQTAHELGRSIIYSMSSMIGKTQSVMCFIDSKDNMVYVETPGKQLKDYYKGYGIGVPEQLDMAEYEASIFV